MCLNWTRTGLMLAASAQFCSSYGTYGIYGLPYKPSTTFDVMGVMVGTWQWKNCNRALLPPSTVRLQNLPWSKTGLVSRQVLHPLSKLQNWIRSKTGRYKTGLVSNTKIEASLRGTKHKPWPSNLTSDTVEIFIQDQFSSQTGFASSIEATKLD